MNVRFGQRGVRQQWARRNRQDTIDGLLMSVDALQDRGGEQKLECTAHRKPRIRAVVRALASGGIQDGHTEALVVGSLEHCQAACKVREMTLSRPNKPGRERAVMATNRRRLTMGAQDTRTRLDCRDVLEAHRWFDSSCYAASTERTDRADRFRKVDIRQPGRAPRSEKIRAARRSLRERLLAEPQRNRAARRSVRRCVRRVHLAHCSRTVFHPAR
jgi:hypothetical protein